MFGRVCMCACVEAKVESINKSTSRACVHIFYTQYMQHHNILMMVITTFAMMVTQDQGDARMMFFEYVPKG